jgi:hypothetical protein
MRLILMKTLNKLLIASTIAFASMGANADLIATDWQATGDSLATLDEATGIEWLDLTQTAGISINQAEGLLNSTFAGWRLPTRSEVTQMMTTAFASQAATLQGVVGGGFTNSLLDNEADNFRSLFGITHQSIDYDYSAGLFKNNVGTSNPLLMSGALDDPSNDFLQLFSNTNIVSDYSYSNVSYGVYLVSDGGTTLSSIANPSLNANNVNAPNSVPLPATALLMGLGLAGLARRKNK